MAYEDRYVDVELVSRGASGARYRARHKSLGSDVYIRELPERMTDARRANLLATIRRVATFGHPHIAAIIDADFDARPAYFVTAAASGTPLRDALEDHDADLVRWSINLLQALLYAHERDTIHYGLTPDRLFIDPAGGLQILDFGVAAGRVDPATGSVELDRRATPYLPIKVLRDPSTYDAASDRYSAAAIIVELLTGRIPDHPNDIDEALIASAREVLSELLTGRSDMRALSDAVDVFETWWKTTVVSGVRPKTNRQRPSRSATEKPAPIEAEPNGDTLNEEQTQRFFDGADSLIDSALDAVSGGAETERLLDAAREAQGQAARQALSTSDKASQRVKDKLSKYAHLLGD